MRGACCCDWDWDWDWDWDRAPPLCTYCNCDLGDSDATLWSDDATEDCALSSSGGAEAVRTGTAVLAGSPRTVAAATDRGGLRTADVVNDSCVASFVCLSPKGAAFATAFRANIVDVAAVVEAPEAPVASGAPDVIDAPEVPDAELFEPMVPGAAPLRDAAGAAGLATAAIVRGGATAASGLPHTLRLGAVTDMAAAAAAGGAAALVAWAPVRLLDILYTQGSAVVLKVLTSDCRPGTSVWLGRTPQQESTCLTPRSGPELSLLVYFDLIPIQILSR
jgi:hypothetical protein